MNIFSNRLGLSQRARRPLGENSLFLNRMIDIELNLKQSESALDVLLKKFN